MCGNKIASMSSVLEKNSKKYPKSSLDTHLKMKSPFSTFFLILALFDELLANADMFNVPTAFSFV
jgi:hypothetical protein